MDEFKDLFLLLKQYLQQQKESMALGTAETMTVLLSAITCALICILLGGAILLFLSFALAIWLGEIMESTSLGYLIVAGLLLVTVILFCIMRKAWIERPIARMMVHIFIEKEIEE